MNLIDVLFDWSPKYLKRMHLGVVVENVDNKRLGRLKVDAPIYSGIEKGLLPWCYPFSANGGSGAGVVSVPEVGSYVLLMFPYQDIHLPFYVPVFVEGTRVNDLHVDYPKSYGFRDSVGNMFRVNKESKEIVLQHNSGTEIKIDSVGNVSISGVKNIGIVGSENISVHSGASVGIVAKNAISLKAEGSGKNVVLEGDFSFDGNIVVNGNIVASGSIIDGGGNTNHHTH